MTLQETIICPGCGWTGTIADLKQSGDCPNCDYHNGMDPIQRLMTVPEILLYDTGTWDEVALSQYTRSLIRVLGLDPDQIGS